MFSNRRISALTLALLVLMSVGVFSAKASTTVPTTTLASWDMSSCTEINNVVYFDDVSGNNILLSTDVSDIYNPFKNDIIGNCIYSEKKSLYRGYPLLKPVVYDELKDTYNASSKPILDAFDNQFTYETWMKVGENNDGNMGSVFMVTGDGENYIGAIQAMRTGSKLGLVFRRTFQTGDVYYDIDKEPELGKWFHLVVAFDSTAATNKPLVMINGIKVMVTDRHQGASGSGKPHTANVSEFRIGQFIENNPFTLSDTSYGKISIYSGLMTEAQAIENYNKEKNIYENKYNIKLCDSYGEIIPKSEVNSLCEKNNSISIDFKGVDKTTVNSSNVYIADITENKWINYDGQWENDIYRLTNFLLVTSHQYKFVIKDLKNKAGEYVCTSEQSVSFVCDPSKSSLKSLGSWDMKAYEQTKTDTFFSDISGNNTFLRTEGTPPPWNVFYNKYIGYTPQKKSMWDYGTYTLKKYDNASGTYIAGDNDVLNAFDNKFTFETWINVTNQKSNVIAGVFMVTGDGNNYVGALQALRQGNTVGLVYRRQFNDPSTGKKDYVYLTLSESLNIDKWNHIVVSCDSSDVNAPMVFVINGVKATYTDSYNWIAKGKGNPHTSGKSQFVMGKIFEGERGYVLDYTEYSDTTIYSGCMTETQAKSSYNQKKRFYENDYSIKLYDTNDKLITTDSYNNNQKQISKFTLDVTNVKTTNNMISVINEATNEITILNGTIMQNIFTPNMSNIKAGDYKLIVSKNMLNSLDIPIRTTDLTLGFSYVPSPIFAIKSVVLSNKTDVVADLATDSQVKAKITVENYSATDAPLAIIAVYNGNILKDVSITGFENSNKTTLTTDLVNVEKGDIIKVMLWDLQLKNLMSTTTYTK